MTSKDARIKTGMPEIDNALSAGIKPKKFIAKEDLIDSCPIQGCPGKPDTDYYEALVCCSEEGCAMRIHGIHKSAWQKLPRLDELRLQAIKHELEELQRDEPNSSCCDRLEVILDDYFQ